MRVQDLIQAEKEMIGWGHYVYISHLGHRLCPQELLVAGQTYVVHQCQRKQAKLHLEADPILAGGPGQAEHQLGDQLIWAFMKAMDDQASVLSGHSGSFLLPPFRMAQLLMLDLPLSVVKSWNDRFQVSNRDIHLICEIQGHWVYLHGHWSWTFHGHAWTYYDGLRQTHLVPQIRQATLKIADALDSHHLGLSDGWGISQDLPNTCGTIALLHMAQALGLLSFMQTSDVWALHAWLLSQQSDLGDIVAGGPEDWQRDLAQLLQTKGVPASESAQRAQQVMKKLGTKQTQAILKAKKPLGRSQSSS